MTKKDNEASPRGIRETTVISQLEEIERRLEEMRVATSAGEPEETAAALVEMGETVLELWIRAHEKEPTQTKKEGFRLLALHRQGARGEPSFNACRETCRELVYLYNVIIAEPAHPHVAGRVRMMVMVARHLCLFVSGKIQVAELGDFCCASKPLREDGN